MTTTTFRLRLTPPASLRLRTQIRGAAGPAGDTGPAGPAPLAYTVVALTDAATVSIDAALGNIFTLTAGGNRTIDVPTNQTSGQKIVIRHYANGAARTLALAVGGFRFGSDVSALTQTVSGKADYIGCIYNATDSLWDVVAYSKGY